MTAAGLAAPILSSSRLIGADARHVVAALAAEPTGTGPNARHQCSAELRLR